MLNKKLIAIAIAAGFSANAAAAIDTNATTAVGTVTYANEAIPTLTAGKFALTNASNALDVLAQTGFSIPAGETRYMRVDLTGGTFASVPSLSVAASSTVVGTGASTKPVVGSVAQGGSGASSVVFLITAPAAETGGASGANEFDGGIAAANIATIASGTFNVDPTATLTAKYALYETAGAAIAQNLPLATSDAAMVTFATANTGDISTATKATATVATQFKEFGAVGAGDKTEAVLTFNPTDAVTGIFIKQTGMPFTETDLFGGSAQNVTFTGNFTFGTWELNTLPTCAPTGGTITPVTLDTAKTTGVASLTVATTAQYLCVEVNGTTDVVSKGSYSVSTTTPAITATDVGSIVYDTTSISIPYVTTFGDYNQRIYIRNDSSIAASYTTSFVSEAGTNAVGGTKATGTVPGNSLVAIKASDLVTITGDTTRTSAVIEIEATKANVTAVTQTVNLSDKSTDTVSLVVE